MAKLNPESRFKFIVLTILCFIIVSMFMYRYDSATRSAANTVRILENAEAIKFVADNQEVLTNNSKLILINQETIIANDNKIIENQALILANQIIIITQDKLEKPKNANIR